MKTTITLLAALLLAPLTGLAAAENSKPNIVIILADDLGYGDVSCYGATKIKTPNIDRLARQGMKFTDAHTAASVCSPSRYGLMTGRSPWRLHKKGNSYSLEPGRMAMASLLKTNGYHSAAIGKWHLGYSQDWNKPPITGPLEVGFDYHFGVPQNHNDSPRCFIENHDIVGRKPGEAFRIVKGRDFPEGLANRAWMTRWVPPSPPRPSVSSVRTRASLLSVLHSLRPAYAHYPGGGVSRHQPGGFARGLCAGAGCPCGAILSTLDELTLTDKTLIIFTSDNGGTPKDFKGTQDTKLNLASEAGGIREKFTTAKADAKVLGHVTNGKWHDGKGSPFEGGHRVPFVMRWPAVIKAGRTCDELVGQVDLRERALRSSASRSQTMPVRTATVCWMQCAATNTRDLCAGR